MTAKIILRIAACLMLFHLLGHMIGATTWKNNPDPKVQQVIRQMVDNKFMFMGANQSLATHMDGYGFACALALLFFAMLLWIVSGADATTKAMGSKIVFVVSLILLLWAIDELIYFFPFAAAISLATSILGFYSLTLLKKIQ